MGGRALIALVLVDPVPDAAVAGGRIPVQLVLSGTCWGDRRWDDLHLHRETVDDPLRADPCPGVLRWGELSTPTPVRRLRCAAWTVGRA